MATQTTNLGLHLWEEDDYVLMGDFNADHQSIDGYVNTVNGQLAALRHDLTANLLQTNENLFRTIIPSYYAGSFSGDLKAMFINKMESAEEAGTYTGGRWVRHPTRVGLGSRLVTGSSAAPVVEQEDIFDLSIVKTLALEGKYTQATLLMQLWGYIPWASMPYADSRSKHTEDYAGLTGGSAIAAKLGGQAMTFQGAKNGNYYGSEGSTANPAVREYAFSLDGAFENTLQVKLEFHIPQDHCIRVYDWALLLG